MAARTARAPRKPRRQKQPQLAAALLVPPEAVDEAYYNSFNTYRVGEVAWVEATAYTTIAAFDRLFGGNPQYQPSLHNLPVAVALQQFDTIRDYAEQRLDSGLGEFFQWLQRVRILSDPAEMERIRGAGLVRFSELELYFTKHIPVYVDGAEPYAGLLESATVQYSMAGPYLALCIRVVGFNSTGHVGELVASERLPYFSGMCSVHTLSVRPATLKDQARLAPRGEVFAQQCLTTGLRSYTGVLSDSSWLARRFRADGRVILDSPSLAHFEPNIARQLLGRLDDAKQPLTFTEAEYWRVYPWVPAFSLKLKRWGLVSVLGLADVQFRKDAFDLLVMDQELKGVIRSLVEHSGDAFSDVIDGKSGGAILLLHGSPGLGKTLTAEAVAEVLERPLYAVSIGELGTDPQDLEERLQRILEIAERWKAVLLLDEADIFLEARDQHDVVRNAMVGVFLRLLEYHSGVLFLTTNRVKTFDPAFHSRISLALHYPDMTTGVREQILTNLFTKAGLDGVDTAKLKHHQLNGRQIKNVLRIAQTLATASNTAVTTESVERVIALTQEFQRQL